jgi:competence protein ComEC
MNILDECVEDHIIELLILSHPHEDHYSFFARVFLDFGIRDVWCTGDALPSLFDGALEARPPSPGIAPPAYHRLTYAERQLTGCLLWTVLGPAEPKTEPVEEDLDDNSLVLLLQYGQVSFLFPGDVRTNAALALQTIELPKGCLVLKVPHHGLASSTSPQFIEWADPELAVISCSVSDDTGPVVANLRTADVPFLTTSANGTIHVSTDGRVVWSDMQLICATSDQ